MWTVKEIIPRENLEEVLRRLRCKHNREKRAINTRIEIGCEGQKTQNNSALNKTYFSPMET